MQVADFYFELPDALIARHPLAERRASRLFSLFGFSPLLAVVLPACVCALIGAWLLRRAG